MGKCQKYLYDVSQTVTDIRALKMKNMYQILSIYISLQTQLMAKNWGTQVICKDLYLIPDYDR